MIKEGDKIKLKEYFGDKVIGEDVYTVEYFRYALGIFISENARLSGDFTPLCSLYGKSEYSKECYIPNYGSYFTCEVPLWIEANQDA